MNFARSMIRTASAVYQRRGIAQVMGHQAMNWLERPDREAEENPALCF